MSSNKQNTSRKKRGLTMVEMSITMSLLVIVMGSLAWAMQGLRGLVASSKDRASLQSSGQLALVEILGDLKSSGVIELDTVRYPVFFEGGDPGPNHEGLEHEPADENAEEGEDDFGRDREIIFVRPADADGDRRPDIDVDGRLVWSTDEISYVLVTRLDGENYLERRTGGEDPQIVARFVERVIFDDAETSGFEIPLGCVRVQLFLRKRNGQGVVHRYFTEGVVTLRNS